MNKKSLGFLLLLFILSGMLMRKLPSVVAKVGGVRDQLLLAADIESPTEVVCTFAEPIEKLPEIRQIHISPGVKIHQIRKQGRKIILTTDSLSIYQNYRLSVKGRGTKPLRHSGILDRFYSDKPLGYSFASDTTVFRLFSPRALKVVLELFQTCDQEKGERYAMKVDEQGVWELRLPGRKIGLYYGYHVYGPAGPGEMFAPEKLIADPYSKAVCTQNNYRHPGKTLIYAHDYDWQGDTFLKLDQRDLIILEAHLRDLTAHKSSGLPDSLRGTYLGLLDPNTPGGINYAKDLGVNAIEFLPIHDFANIEVPYKDRTAPVYNTWNPYARNHWGYMTSYYFAPESYYVTGATLKAGGYSGKNGRAIREFKDVVKTLHRNGIAVILDVVYNHVSQYDQNSFKYDDKKYYFRLDGDLNFENKSGTGNDFKTERPMARRLIVDSVLYWMREYHVDGFRFDIAALLDWDTVDLIARQARKVNPNVILIAEAWGGGKYAPAEFSRHDWAAWNDQIRNGIKGQNPIKGLGFIFGKWWGKNNLKSIQSYITGTLAEDGGLFAEKSHSINYLESHDDYTLGDFIRIGSGAVKEGQTIDDVDANARLSPGQLKLNRLAALCLLTSQGPVMLAQGQDWARSKVIAKTDVPDKNMGTMDHNSYEKDNETNWLNWRHREMNAGLVNYYRGLIALRKSHPAFRRAQKKDFQFFRGEIPFSLGYRLKKGKSGDQHDFVVLFNANPKANAIFALPAGNWEVIVDSKRAGTRRLITARGGMNIVVPPTSGMVFREL